METFGLFSLSYLSNDKFILVIAHIIIVANSLFIQEMQNKIIFK